jgi:hypothetical protein
MEATSSGFQNQQPKREFSTEGDVMTKKASFAVGLMLVLLLGAGSVAFAQGTLTGSLQGTVKDAQGLGIPGVTVTATSTALVRGKTSTVTDTAGVYRFPSLPPGTYLVEAELKGFRKVQQAGVRLGLGTALALDLRLSLESVKADVVVTGEAPLVSVVSNSVSSNFGTNFIEKQAIQRNYYQVITSAPGVNADTTSSSGSAILAYGATTENQNAYTLDGVNIGDSGSGAHWVLPSIQWMEEIQVTGLGAGAEYGGYTGGIINGITKSGGNEFHGGLEIYYEPTSWVSSNSPTGTQETFKFEDYSLNVGGPIVREKLWFFASAEYWHQISTPVGAIDTSDRSIPRFLGKLTYQANEKNRISLMGEYDAVTNERRGISRLTLPSGSRKQDGPGFTFAANWESTLNSSNFINVKVTGYDGNDDYLPYSGTAVPGHIDYYGDTGITWFNAPLQELNHRHNVTGDASWSLFSDGLFGKSDSHSFKFGALYEEASSSDSWRRNGGYTYYDDSTLCSSTDAYFKNPTCGQTERSKGYGEYEVHGQQKGFTFYAQDSVRLDRVTINAGLRYTGYRAGWQPGSGNSDVYSVDFLDPRIGVVWDVAGDARWAVKAHWGRYHSSMYTYLYDREVSGHGYIPDSDSEWDPKTQTWGPWSVTTPRAGTMGSVSHPYVDEFLFSVEHQLSTTMSLGFDFIDRRFHSIMGLVNTNNDYSPVAGIPNPLAGGTLPVWTLNSAPVFQLTTDTAGYRDYDSLVLRFDKRYASGWQLRSSLVWTDLKGNVLKNNGYANELLDRNGLVNADGKMDFSSNEWEFKLSGAVDLPLGFMASGQYTYLSGQYWTPYGRVDSYLNYNSSTGRYVNLLERGAEKLPSRNLLDLRLAWGTKIAGTVRLELSLECFNTLNESTTLNLDTYYGRYRKGAWSKNATYGTPLSIERPREFRAGFRLQF